MPGLNQIISAKALRFGNGGASGYSKMKKDWGGTIALLARAQGMTPFTTGYFTYVFREPDKRRDPSNIIAGGVKMVEDALQTAGLFPNDGWAGVLGMVAYWTVDKDDPGVAVFVHPERLLTKQEALDLDQEARRTRGKGK